MSSESGSASPMGSPGVFRLCVGLSVFGAAQPLLALARGAEGTCGRAQLALIVGDNERSAAFTPRAARWQLPGTA